MSELFVVEKAGLLSTLQDAGRFGKQHFGIPESGPMDRFAFTVGNRLVGNRGDEVALEFLLMGPQLRACCDAVISITGANYGPTVNGEPVPTWASVELRKGDILRIGQRTNGCWGYFAVAGGIAADMWFGSAATYLLVGRGGFHGRVLRKGDVLHGGVQIRLGRHHQPRPFPGELIPAYAKELRVRVVPGPHYLSLVKAQRDKLLSTRFTVSADSNRLAYRLLGEPIESGIRELLSYHMPLGSVELAHSGLPMVLMADHPTTGGYPVFLRVIQADLWKLAHSLPGDFVSFELATRSAAIAAKNEIEQLTKSAGYTVNFVSGSV